MHNVSSNFGDQCIVISVNYKFHEYLLVLLVDGMSYTKIETA